MNVVLGYQQEDADPQQAMVAKMVAMMHRMEAMMDPVLAQKMAGEQVSSGSGLHLVADAMKAMEI